MRVLAGYCAPYAIFTDELLHNLNTQQIPNIKQYNHYQHNIKPLGQCGAPYQ